MKPGTFTLNPYAASYIPLSKREGSAGNDKHLYTQSPTHLAQRQHHVSLEALMPKRSSDMQYKQMGEDDTEMYMDMEYLLTSFPGLSHESITDVYLANNGDIDAATDMLNQLEMFSYEPENLPDTLDIGDVSESGTSTAAASKHNDASNFNVASSKGTPKAPLS